MWARSPFDRASKMTISSSRLRNSGLNDARTIGEHRLALVVVLQRRVDEERRAQVAGQDQQRVAEVDRAALAVGQPTVVEHLEQDVEHLRVGLLDLVEQHDGVRTAADGLGELAALLVPDVPGWRPDEPRDRMLLGVLAHVDAHDRPLVVEQEVRQRLGQLGLAGAGRAEEQERAGGPVRVGDARTRAAYGVAHRAHGVGLADQSPADRPAPSRAAWRSRPGASCRWGCRSRPRRRRRSAGRRPPRRRAARASLAFSVSSTAAILLLQLGDGLVADLAGALEVALAQQLVGLDAQLVERAAQLALALQGGLLALPAGLEARGAPPRGRRGRRAACRAGRPTPGRSPWPARTPPSSAARPGGGAGRSPPARTRSPSAAGRPPRRRGRSPCRAAGGR